MSVYTPCTIQCYMIKFTKDKLYPLSFFREQLFWYFSENAYFAHATKIRVIIQYVI